MSRKWTSAVRKIREVEHQEDYMKKHEAALADLKAVRGTVAARAQGAHYPETYEKMLALVDALIDAVEAAAFREDLHWFFDAPLSSSQFMRVRAHLLRAAEHTAAAARLALDKARPGD
jgi:hypothetical protein